jgi:hypothetical protein
MQLLIFCNRGFSLRGKHFGNSVKCFRLSDLILGYTLGIGAQNLQVIQSWWARLNPFATRPISGRATATVFAADRDRILSERAPWTAGRANAKKTESYSRKLESHIQQNIQCDSFTIDPGIEPSFSVTSAKETTSAFEDGHFFILFFLHSQGQPAWSTAE